MIKNDFQYRITKTQLKRLEDSHAQVEAASNGYEPLMRELQADAHQSLIHELRRNLREYDALRAGKRTRFKCDSLDKLPETLIKARIAQGLTHQQLADLLNIKVQQLQRYEATDYESISFAKLSEIADALGIEISFRATLGEMPHVPSVEQLTAKPLTAKQRQAA